MSTVLGMLPLLAFLRFLVEKSRLYLTSKTRAANPAMSVGGTPRKNIKF